MDRLTKSSVSNRATSDDVQSEGLLHIAKFLLLLAIIFQLSACANKRIAFRPLSPTAQECLIYANNRYSTRFQERLVVDPTLAESEVNGAASGCYVQRDRLVLDGTSEAIQYQLNFLEFQENGALREPGQWDAISDALSQPGGAKYVVLFVHGWRHDARPDDTNVRSFRAMLAYSARHLHERQETYGKDARVIGIYIGWPGNEWKWAWVDKLQVPAFITFWSRKKESEYLAAYVSDYIHRIKGHINPIEHSNGLNRFLIIGHSFGGNLLINALKESYEDAIPPVDKMTLPIKGISDLTVLLNPASDFSNWKEIQEVEYKRSGYQSPPGYDSFVHGDNKFFDSRQKPILMSITGTCDWGKINKGDGPLDCDWATRWAFSVGQTLALRTDFDQSRALGHVRAYRSHSGNQNYGITHELEDNSPAAHSVQSDNEASRTFYPTSYTDAASEGRKCPLGDNWLGRVQGAQGREWDTYHFPIPSRQHFHPQMRHGSFQRKFTQLDDDHHKAYNTLGPSHEPFWNVASHESIVPGHNIVFSHQLWCLLDQFVLDSITDESK